MYEGVTDALSGLLVGIMSGTVAFFIVMLLSFVYRYFTTEKLSSFLGIVFGLGFLGFSGGLLAVLEQPTVGGVIEIVAVSIFTVWGVNIGDKIAEKIPTHSGALSRGFGRKRDTYIKVKLPIAEMILDIPSKKRVANSVKTELSEREFVLPSDLPIEEVGQRIRRRLVTDWDIGYAEIEADKDGKVTHLAISAKEEGLSSLIPEGNVALPIECKIIPSNLVAGDFIRIILSKNDVIEEVEVIGVNSDQKVVTIVAPFDWIEKIRDKKAELVVALPHVRQRQKTISVKRKSGVVEDFKVEKIYSSLSKFGVSDEVAKDIVIRVENHLLKVEGPVSTGFIKSVIFEELEKIAPEEAKKLRTRKVWKL